MPTGIGAESFPRGRALGHYIAPMRVLLFASYAEALGAPSIDVSLPSGATVDDLVRLVRAMPGAERVPPRPLVAVNLDYASGARVLAPHDEVALIPPVAGG
jgi:molybdopterin converting factor subunit 1